MATSENQNFCSGTLLLCFAGRGGGERLVAAAKRAGAGGATLVPGKTRIENSLLQACGLAEARQDIVLILLLGPERRAVTEAVLAAALEGRMKGMAMTLALSDLFFRQNGTRLAAKADMEKKSMKSGHKLITVIVNNGWAEDVMAAARQAGARGGTILTARGTGTEEDVKFFGMTLVPEKDMLIIVAAADIAPAVMEAVSAMPCLCEPGGGIVFSLEVEELRIFNIGHL